MKTELAKSKMEHDLAPRFLSPKQQTIIADAVRRYPPQQIRIQVMGNPEADLYAEQFAKFLKPLGWQVEKLPGGLVGPPQFGLSLYTNKEPSEGIKALISAMKKAGLNCSVKTITAADAKFGPQFVELLVGDKDPTDTKLKKVR